VLCLWVMVRWLDARPFGGLRCAGHPALAVCLWDEWLELAVVVWVGRGLQLKVFVAGL
jgi:hypothetical protein